MLRESGVPWYDPSAATGVPPENDPRKNPRLECDDEANGVNSPGHGPTISKTAVDTTVVRMCFDENRLGEGAPAYQR